MISFETIAGVLWRLQMAQQTMKRRTETTRMMMAPSGSGSVGGGSTGTSTSSAATRNSSTMVRARANAFVYRSSILSKRRSHPASISTTSTSTCRPVATGTAEIDEFDMNKPSEQIERLQPTADESNLYNYPTGIYPEYQPIHFPIKVILGSLSILKSAKMHKISAIFAQATHTTKNPLPGINMKLILTTFATFFLSMTIIQDIFYAPSRIATSTLLKNQWLPSPLSKYSIVSTSVPSQLLHQEDNNLFMDPIGVHFLEYENKNDALSTTQTEYKFDAIHFNHGFGASSLSWLPVIPSLMNKLGGRVSIAHDAPGFGFTDRPSASGRYGGLVPFSSAGNAALGNALLMNRLKNSDEENDGGGGAQRAKRVVLLGHSMGCASTLKMALTLPADVEKTIVLIAPALVGDLPDKDGGSSSSTAAVKSNSPVDGGAEVNKSIKGIIRNQPANIKKWVGIFIAVLRRVILDPVIVYILKRAVGQPKSWMKGLRFAWGDPSKLSDTDALRYQWPSIGLGWEKGLLAFTRSRISSTCPYDGGELQLLREVASMKNTKVIVVHGTRDPVVPLKMSRKIVENLGGISFVPIDGSGHDPFEENIDEFVDIVTAKIGEIS